MTQACFQCGETLPPEPPTVRVDGRTHAVCCPGCQAVVETVQASGLGDYFRFRTSHGPRPQHDGDLSAWDAPELAEKIVTRDVDGSIARLAVGGIRCAACAWLIETRLEALPGVRRAELNPVSGELRVRMDPQQVPPSRLMRTVVALGYRPSPVTAAARVGQRLQERRGALKRLAVAGIGMMQVMMYATAGYFGADVADPAIAEFLRWVSLAVTAPVVGYAALPFIRSAWRGLRARHPGMDLPVSIAILAAFGASAFHTLTGQGEVYYDSVLMFVFFLSLGRFLEMAARHRAAAAVDELGTCLPPVAWRLGEDDLPHAVPSERLAVGDRIRLRAGETVPVDALVTGGEASLDESVLTGESAARTRGPGMPLIAGSRLLQGTLQARVVAVGENTRLAAVRRLLERARGERPPLARLADRVAAHFVVAVLLIAGSVAATWWQLDPARAFEITLAVLVVTCPCALSLATPTALTAATGALARRGFALTRGRALEALADVDHVLMDKTGTLTVGSPTVIRTLPVRGDAEQAHGIAQALEAGSSHPLARAFQTLDTGSAMRGADRGTGDGGDRTPVEQVREVPGRGVEGVMGGHRYRLGSAAFAGGGTEPPEADGEADTWVCLSDADGILAWFQLRDRLRAGARDAVARLTAMGMSCELLSGDSEAATAAVAGQLGIRDYRGRMSPEAKLARLQTLRRAGHRVAMLGDGVNDGPVLAGADLAVAMGSGSALATSQADAVITGSGLDSLADARHTARRAMAIIRQNLAWAAAYNLSAIPLAATGLVAPWMAALGMSMSSLVVVGNALRLSRADACSYISDGTASSGSRLQTPDSRLSGSQLPAPSSERSSP